MILIIFLCQNSKKNKNMKQEKFVKTKYNNAEKYLEIVIKYKDDK